MKNRGNKLHKFAHGKSQNYVNGKESTVALGKNNDNESKTKQDITKLCAII